MSATHHNPPHNGTASPGARPNSEPESTSALTSSGAADHSRGGGSAPLVLIAPAMAIGSGFYTPLVAEFAQHGWDARTVGRRGFERGQPQAARGHDWSYQDEIADLASAVTDARAECPDRPILLLGHSLGGQLVAGHQLTYPAVDAVVTVAASIPDHRTYRYRGPHLLLMGAVVVPLLTALFGYLPAPAFGGPGARTLMRQWARMVVTGRPPYPADRPIQTPALVVSFASDAMAPSRSVDAFAEKLFDASTMTRWHYDHDDAASGTSIDHIGWVRGSTQVVTRIVHWWTSTRRD